MEVSLEEIFSGKKIVVHVPTKIKCKTCDGNGHEANSKPELGLSVSPWPRWSKATTLWSCAKIGATISQI